MSDIKTPLCYSDALELADQACQTDNLVALRDRIARALISVDVASRAQSGALALLDALRGLMEEARIDFDSLPPHAEAQRNLTDAQKLARAVLFAADPEVRPLPGYAVLAETK